jgi:hypothetical protein
MRSLFVGQRPRPSWSAQHRNDNEKIVETLQESISLEKKNCGGPTIENLSKIDYIQEIPLIKPNVTITTPLKNSSTS